ncbi:hypothetical protein BGZ65_004596 [Modicella reniformis]|uniref:BZIP domain-containing protein n=1 Tax=Modicella reniformis TaxID=1440133 RepID=A0A9P6LRR0_9FUNG|nr:hypothetical protein BGZ65_004596 [Modicella reniformis]
MASTAQLDRHDKRPFPGSPPPENADGYNPDDDNDDLSFQGDFTDNNIGSPNASVIGADEFQDPTAQPPQKTRKKPGRKPNPASPAVRKEQNRAAQRAFRDRKERHLQQLENMIKDLKDSQHHANIRFQRETQQLKGIIESLQSENYYLREVVFSFESALGKTGNGTLLQDVKAELYRRHYENHAARKISISVPSQSSPSTSSIGPGRPVPVDDSTPHATQVQMLNQALAAMAAHTAAMTANINAAATAKQPFATNPVPMNNVSSTPTVPSNTHNAWPHVGLADPQDDNIFSMNRDVLCKAPSLFSSNSSSSDDGKMSNPVASVDPLAAARSNLAASANWLPKQTYDDLQATLFSQANLQSNSSNSRMSSPQNLAADATLFGQMPDQPSFSPNQNMFTFSANSMDSAFPRPTPPFLDSDDVDSNEFTTLPVDDKQDVIPSFRLQSELRTLASAVPATDPSIDLKIYAIPHDTRIDLIPCPKLRANMILHQHQYNIEELCQLLLGGAICHGNPLDPHNWELPQAFFDRYGYLMGQELMKYKYKVWPKKSEPQRQSRYHAQ